MNHYKYDEIEVGMVESFSRIITEQMQEMFLQISGDENPLHNDATFAKEKGYVDKVVYGMLTASLFSTLAGVYMPGEKSLLQSVESKFVKPVYIGDELTVTGKVVEKSETYELIRVKAEIRNQRGEKVCRGLLQIGLI